MTKINSNTRDIRVHTRILRHISRGIYRTPAGALKEIVSNSSDAGAKTVTINTDYGEFKRIIITDDGTGMSKMNFEKIMTRIGFSDKEAGSEFALKGSTIKRKRIGHYGIGLLAIGQLCGQVTITSKEKGIESGFETTIDFDEIEKKGEENVYIKDEKNLEKKEIKERKEKHPSLIIGRYSIKTLKYEKKYKNTSFTKIEMNSIRTYVREKLTGSFENKSVNFKAKLPYSSNFANLLKILERDEKMMQQGQYKYEQLCWELANYSPIDYPNLDIFKKNGALNFFKNLTENNSFELVVDGMKLNKPYTKAILENDEYPIRKVFKWTDEEYRPGQKISGFLIYKQRVRPKYMRGVLIRVAGVAVGIHDSTYMGYPYHEGPKFEQLTGEIFAEGLSGALNIDRSSFNETDDNYLKMVAWFHKKLHKDVFPEIQKIMKKTQKQSSSDNLLKLFNSYKKTTNKKFKLKILAMGKEAPIFSKKSDTLYINTSRPEGKPKNANIEKLMMSCILVMNRKLKAEDIDNLLTELSDLQENIKK